jgi:hypothetical protein
MHIVHEFSSSSEASLDLVKDEQAIILLAQGLHLSQVALLRHDATGLSLDGFNHDGADELALFLQLSLYISQVVVVK